MRISKLHENLDWTNYIYRMEPTYIFFKALFYTSSTRRGERRGRTYLALFLLSLFGTCHRNDNIKLEEYAWHRLARSIGNRRQLRSRMKNILIKCQSAISLSLFLSHLFLSLFPKVSLLFLFIFFSIFYFFYFVIEKAPNFLSITQKVQNSNISKHIPKVGFD